jgi:hypothetical protein
MNDSQTIAWIFYALEMASGDEPAEFRSISQLADGINHAVPTDKELRTSLSWLTAAGLVIENSRKFQVTAKGKEVLSVAHVDTTTISQAWARLTQEIKKLGAK